MFLSHGRQPEVRCFPIHTTTILLLSIFSLAETISLRIQCPGMRRAVVSRYAIAPFDKFSFVSLQFSLTERMYFHLPNKIKQKKNKKHTTFEPFPWFTI